MTSFRTKLATGAERARPFLLPVVIAGAVVIFGATVHPYYPIQKWLFWVYARMWLWCALFAGACLSLGHLVLRALVPRGLPLRERLAFTGAAGVLAFFYLMFVAGLLRLYGPVLAVALPVACIAAGAPLWQKRARKVIRHLRAARSRGLAPGARPLPLWYFPVLVCGLLLVGLVYFAILSPRNIAFDAYFYHLGLAQQYATEGAIRGAPEGWVPATIPHLASILYTWCFTLPGMSLEEKILCAAHLEFVVFLFTLASIPLLVRWLVPRDVKARTSMSWAAIALFPGILLYDSSLTVAADHIAALWGVPIYLAFRRAWRRLEIRPMLLLATLMAGAILTKYQTMYLLALPVLALIGRTAWLVLAPRIRRWRRKETLVPADEPRALRVIAGLAAAAGAGLLLTSAHWLKNWIWYGDPLFPYLLGTLSPGRWAPDTGRLFKDWNASLQLNAWTPKGTFLEKLLDTLRVVVVFPFQPHDWNKFHGHVPVFGSLFTLSVMFLPFVRGARRVWGLVGATLLGVFVWYWTMHQDRYLQVLVPWMAASLAAALILVWRATADLRSKANVAARGLLVVLLCVQVIWGGDVYFIPGHAMTGRSPASVTSDLLGQGYAKKYDDRLTMTSGPFKIGRAKELPRNARILLHEDHLRLGLWRPVVMDIAGYQYGVRYDLLGSRAAVHDALRKLGVTHIVSRSGTSRAFDSLTADLRFFDYLMNAAVVVKGYGDFTLYRLPDKAPDASSHKLVAYLGCNKFYQPGLHDLDALNVRERQVQKPPPMRAAKLKATADEAGWAAVLERADFAVTGDKCKPAVPSSALGDFTKMVSRTAETLWMRRAGHPAPRQ